MKSTRRDALLAGGVVAVLAVLGVALFLFSGSGNAVLFFVAGVPVILIVGGFMWHRRETRMSTTTSPRIESMTDDLVSDVRELLTTYGLLDAETPWDPSEYADPIADLRRDLENRGFEISTDGAVEVEVTDYLMGPGAVSSHRENVQSIRDDLEAGYRAHVEAEIEAMNDQLDRLVDEGLLDDDAGRIDGLAGVGADPERLTEALQSRWERFFTQLERAEERVYNVTGNRVDNWELIEERIANGRYEAAAELVAEPGGSETPDVESQKAELLDLIDTIESSAATQYADPSRLETLSAIRSDLKAVDSAYEAEELLDGTLRSRAGETCIEIVRDLRTELTGYVETFTGPDVPDGFFRRPSVLGRDLESELKDAGSGGIAPLQAQWTSQVDDLTSALDDAAKREGALRAYDDVADVVERTLASDGEVTASDVPYDPAEPIMRLYAHRNTDTTFLPGRTALTQGSDIAGQKFDLAVDIRLDPPETREVAVSVAIREETHRRTRTIDGSGRVRFEGILGGDATVAASADDDRFGSRETDLLLDHDQTVELRLAEETAIDRLCAGVQTNAELLLTEVEDEITARYEAEQYLTDGMDLGVKDEYAPCVLALWADDVGLSVQVDDDTVLVYDRQRMQNQLVDLTEQRVGSGGELAYEKIRDRFLKPPASDDLIRDILTQADLDVDVELEADRVVSA